MSRDRALIKGSCLFLCSILSALSGCDSAKSDLENARRLHTESAYEAYLAKYPKSEYQETARDELRKLRWESARQSRNIRQLEAYVNLYPESPDDLEARRLLDEVKWDEISQGGDVDALWHYIEGDPTGSRAEVAASRIKVILNSRSSVPVFNCQNVFDVKQRQNHSGSTRKGVDGLVAKAPGTYLSTDVPEHVLILVLEESGASGIKLRSMRSLGGRFEVKSEFRPAEEPTSNKNDRRQVVFGNKDDSMFCTQLSWGEITDIENSFTYSGGILGLGSIGSSAKIHFKNFALGAYVGKITESEGHYSVTLTRVGSAFPDYMTGVANLALFGNRLDALPGELVFRRVMGKE